MKKFSLFSYLLAGTLLVLGSVTAYAQADFTRLKQAQLPWLTNPPKYSFPNPDAEAYKKFVGGEDAGVSLAATEWPKTYRVGIVRVEFQPDNTETTSGNGTWGDIPVFTFDASGNIVEDPTVNTRDKEYVRRIMLWTSQYYEEVSQGKVLFQVPDESDISDIYVLDHQMAEYGADDDYSTREAQLAVDAITAADNEMDFSKYDVLMVFHAGCGQHTDFDGVSVDDIHPVSINATLLREILADGDPEYMGVETNDTNPDGSPFYASFIQIFPETAVQDWDQEGNAQGALQGTLGVICHELGHFFGGADLYDVYVGSRPTIGFYALMATGFFNSVSRIPAHPMAWHRIYYGWEEPLVVSGNWQNIVLQAAEIWSNEPKIIKVPISSSEYYLLELRLRDENFNNRFDFNETGNNFFPDVMTDDYRLPDGSLAEFDYSIPNVNGLDSAVQAGMDSTSSNRLGSGVLIWHIDEKVIRESLTSDLVKNYVNTDPYHLGVGLEEADGLPHMREPFPAALDPGFGSPFDVFGGKVAGYKDDNRSALQQVYTAGLIPAYRRSLGGNLNTLFSVYTDPSSTSYTGLPSNIEISGFTSVTVDPGQPVVDSLVSISIKFDAVSNLGDIAQSLSGWPKRIDAATSISEPIVVDLDPTSPGAEVVQVTDSSMIVIYRSNGEVITRGASLVPAKLGDKPLVGDISGDGKPEIIFEFGAIDGSGGGSTVVYTPNEGSGNFLDGDGGVISSEFVISSSNMFGIVGNIETYGSLLADYNADGVLDYISTRKTSSGDIIFMHYGVAEPEHPAIDYNINYTDLTAPAVQLNADGSVKYIFFGSGEGHYLAMNNQGGVAFDIDLGSPVVATPVVARLGLPGTEQASYKSVTATADGDIYIIDEDGSIVEGWPVSTAGGQIRSGMAVGDIDGDGLNEIVVPVEYPDTINEAHHKIYALDFNGSALPGWPKDINVPEVRSDQPYLSGISLADVNGDNAQDIIVSTALRVALIYDHSMQPTPIARFITGLNSVASPVPADIDGNGTLDILLSDSEGYLYAYDTGESGADVQWAGTGGSPTRSGTNIRLQTSPGLAASQAILPEQGCYIYPNPVRPGTSAAHIVYSLGKSDITEVTVRIVTVSGEIVASLDGPTVAADGVSNEIVWDVGRYASGVYLAVIKASSASSGSDQLIRKIAVIK